MNLPTTRVLLVALAVVALGVTLVAHANPNVALVAGLAAAGAAVAAAALELLAGLDRRAASPLPEPPVDTLASFRSAFTGSALARERLIDAIAALDRAAGARGRGPLSRGEETRLAAASPEEFRAWVRSELDRLEAVG